MIPENRSKLFNTLSSLSEEDFGSLLFSLRPPAGIVPGMAAPQKSRVAALLEWAESFGGCGLMEVQDCLNSLAIRSDYQRVTSIEKFQDYLNSVCTTYQDYWKPYVFIDEIDKSSWFEFQLSTKVQQQNSEAKKFPIVEVIQELTVILNRA